LSAARLFLSAQHASLAGRDSEKLEAPKLAVFAQNALAALQSTETILAELLYMSSLDSRAIRPAIREIEVGGMLSQLGVEFSALARERGLSLRVVATGMVARTDPAMLRRVLQNFLANAVRYTPKGRILLGCRRRGDKIRIEVWDTGVGVADNMRQEIFQEFRRLDQEPSGAEKGVGLGLAVVDRIARLLDAPLTVRSKLGQGSMFAIEAPLASARASGRAPVSTPAPVIRNSQGLLVLCIDNDQPIREGLKALLEQWGHRAVCAHDLDSAIDTLDGAEPDLVLVDYHLDGPRNGLQVLAELRRLWTHDAPAVLITANRADDVRRAASAARCELLHKPVKPAALRRFLNRVGLGVTSSGGDE